MWRLYSASLTLLFFSLQVLAIGVEAIPKTAHDPLSLMLRGFWQPLTHPYIALTSQWQNWNLFAPDPLREVVTVFVDVRKESDLWEEVLVLGPGICKWPATSCGGWRETALLKVARALAEEHPKYARARQDFLQRLCPMFGIPGGGTLRLRAREADLAQISTVSEVVRAESVCSSPS